MVDKLTTATDRSILCRFGLHKWSEARGGIKICLRDGCEKATTYGLTGSMRQLAFEQRLYEKYQESTTDEDRPGRERAVRSGSDSTRTE
jgi:hypothetical protein